MKISRKDLPIFMAVGILMLLVTLGLREIANTPRVYEDYPTGAASGSTLVVIENGATGEEIGRTLEESGVIAAWQRFFQLAVTDERASRIAPGTYRLQKGIPVRTALEQLLDLDRIQGLLTLRDGVRLAEVQALLESNGFKEVEEVLDEVRVPEPFTFDSIEGFLYPAKYSFAPKTSTFEVVNAFLLRFSQAVQGVDWSSAPGELSPNQVLTLASLIEAEGTPDVFAKISAVIQNRLKRGMPLQLDSTVHYIQNSRGNIALSLKETKIDNPYNTYQRRGLPPGPIGSPTRAAIDAAITPASGDWLYFITVAPGETRFTNSYERFLEWKRLYRENYAKGLFDD